MPHDYGVKMIAAWEGGVQDLVVGFEMPKGPPLAYILPVPDIPTKFGTVEAQVFYEMKRELRQEERMLSIVMDDDLPTARSLKVHEVKEVGPFLIHPLEARGEAGLAELQKWMGANGFDPIPPETAKYYVDREWAFLAVKLDRDAKKIPSLHVRFDAARIVLPLKLLAASGGAKLSFEAFVLSGTHLNTETIDGLHHLGLRAESGDRHTSRLRTTTIVPGKVGASTQKLIAQFHIAKRQKIWVSYVSSQRLQKSASEWVEDISLPLMYDDEKLFGGDRMPPMPVGAIDPPFPDATLGNWSDPVPEEVPSPHIEHVTGSDPRVPAAEAKPDGCTGCAQSGTGDVSLWFLAMIVAFRRRTSGPRRRPLPRFASSR